MSVYAQRHVRLCDLGRADAETCACQGPPRKEAALLLSSAGRLDVCLGVESLAGRWNSSGHRSCRDSLLSDLSIHSGPQNNFPEREKTASRTRVGLRRREGIRKLILVAALRRQADRSN